MWAEFGTAEHYTCHIIANYRLLSMQKNIMSPANNTINIKDRCFLCTPKLNWQEDSCRPYSDVPVRVVTAHRLFPSLPVLCTFVCHTIYLHVLSLHPQTSSLAIFPSAWQLHVLHSSPILTSISPPHNPVQSHLSYFVPEVSDSL